MIGPAQFGQGTPVTHDHEMVHAVFVDDEVQEIIQKYGSRRMDGILKDIRAELTPELGPMQGELLDHIEPMKREHHKDDGMIEYFQKVDRPEARGAWDV